MWFQIFVEGTYEGDLVALAGISTVIGRESTSAYGESLAGIRGQTTYRQIIPRIDPYVRLGDATSGLLYGVSAEPFGVPGSGDVHLQAYSYRIPLTDVAANRVPIARPPDYDPSKYDLHRRYAAAGGEFFVPRARLPNSKTDLIGSECPLATDLLNMNDGWPAGDSAERKRISTEATSFTKGLLYFFSSDSCVPVSSHITTRALIDNAFRSIFGRNGVAGDTAEMSSRTMITSHEVSTSGTVAG